ncbi:NIC-domain-containing protein [Yamadazyma tenuis ATCC 10573]|uniref:NIC-domain-containing protein n=1 Tax=Candida tenuis (strain ATCC 10573 / BCRC 21748 / CBS 615 / JCM 9827 / NBRC 10315 / NRRL Y-1498 / VKM Y-70) TaxID=590646 RepID=G3AYI6_CANTC|nr:NIC-domain-containing protein [Yamadazyma tenuis ATCC 10573]EGV65859.1 NIC-domain-containing protein [Yamadazyma tenuis ATCC 10573]
MSLFGQQSSTGNPLGAKRSMSSSGLFGSAANSNNNNTQTLPAAPNAFSFGQPSQQQNQPPQQNQQPQQLPQPQQPQQQNQSQQQNQQPQVQPANSGLFGAAPSTTVHASTNSTSKLLKDLIESANNLPKINNHDLGSIHLTLNELQRKSNEMRKNKDDSANFTRAHYLLASSGISAEEIESDLKAIDFPVDRHGISQISGLSGTQQSLNKVIKPRHVGIDQFLNTKKEQNLLATIEQSLTAASRDFDEYISKTISIDWKVKRNELRKSVINQNFNNPSSDSTLAKSITWNKSVPGNFSILAPLSQLNSKSSTRQYTREKFEQYATVIYQLNESRMSHHHYALFSNFEELNKPSNDLKSKQITDVYKILIQLSEENKSKVIQEQKFFDLYQTDDTQKRTNLNELVIKKSKSYLEEQFYQYMDEIYNKDKDKQNFLPPNNTNKVKFFINKIIVKNNKNFNEKTLKVNGTPIWALIYYMLRSGLYSEALEMVLSNRELFEKFDKNFPLYLKKFLENGKFKLPHDLNDRFVSEFNHQFAFVNDDLKNLYDPYKYSVYKIIGKCDLSKRTLPPLLNLSIEDWLWFHLAIVNETSSSSDLIYEKYTLENLQKQVISMGAKKLNSSSNNPMYLKCLAMVGLYELAIQYTFEFLSEIDAVHLAIGLNYYGLLKVSSNINKDELIYLNPNRNEYEVNFPRLLGSFTRAFKISDPKVACQYLILISISKGGNSKEDISQCHAALRELILLSREFNLLLGQLDANNGEKISGLLENQRELIKLSDIQDFYNKIIELSAKKCEEEGRVFDSLLLYQLCQEYDTVLSIINRILSELIATTELDESLIKSGNYEVTGEKDTIENNIVLLSKHIVNTFSNNSNILSKTNKSYKNTSDLLLAIISVRESFLAKNFNQVLLDIENLHLIPINPKSDLIETRKLADYVQNSLDNSILKVIPSLLLMTMTSISQINYQILTKSFKSLANQNEEISRLKAMAKNCMVFAGIIQYKMPRETYSVLVQLESQL